MRKYIYILCAMWLVSSCRTVKTETEEHTDTNIEEQGTMIGERESKAVDVHVQHAKDALDTWMKIEGKRTIYSQPDSNGVQWIEAVEEYSVDTQSHNESIKKDSTHSEVQTKEKIKKEYYRITRRVTVTVTKKEKVSELQRVMTCIGIITTAVLALVFALKILYWYNCRNF